MNNSFASLRFVILLGLMAAALTACTAAAPPVAY